MHSIQPLRALPEHIPTVAKWCFETWGKASALSTSDYETWIHKRLSPDEFGTFWIALERGVPVGCVQLTTWDLPEKKHPIPTLANLFVIPEKRGNHIAKDLCTHIEQAAKREYLDTLYLIADNGIEPFYKKLGWKKYTHDGERQVLVKSLL